MPNEGGVDRRTVDVLLPARASGRAVAESALGALSVTGPVRYLEPADWELADAEIVVAMSSRIDPLKLPAGALRVAWVMGPVRPWLSQMAASVYDVWWTTRVSAAREVTELLDVPATVLPAGEVDYRSRHERELPGLRAATAPSHVRTKLGFFPDWRAGNPFLAMLYSRASRHRVAAYPVLNPAVDDPCAALEGPPGRRILHLHWPDALVQSVPDETTARERFDVLRRHLDLFSGSGGRLVWTVHNVRAHDARYEDLDLLVMQELADRADLVHVMTRDTVEAVAGHTTIDPARVVHIPHPSYVGYYPDAVSRTKARAILGFDPDGRYVLLFGQIRPYKGVDALLDALDEPAVAATGLRAVIAGRPAPNPQTAALLDRCRRHPRVILVDRHVADSEIPVFFKAADVVTLPYSRTLNSGVLMTALALGTPVIGPRAGALAETVRSDFGRLYELGDGGGLAAALLDVGELATVPSRRAARSAAEAVLPADVSDRFFLALHERFPS